MRILAVVVFVAGCGAAALVSGSGDDCPALPACGTQPEVGVALSPMVEVITCKNGDHCVQKRGEKFCQSHCY